MQVVVLISDKSEWKAVIQRFPDPPRQPSPAGEWFTANLSGAQPVIFLHSGVGKIAAAAATQYAIDRWQPALLVNFGTCGGFEGRVEPGALLLADRTLVYDILGQMAGSDDMLRHYTTELDLAWLAEPLPLPVTRALMISADRDLVPEEVPGLAAQHGAIAGDWESAAIAYVAQRNGTRCLIVRGVSDLVGSQGGEAYANAGLYIERATAIIHRLLDSLPAWIAQSHDRR